MEYVDLKDSMTCKQEKNVLVLRSAESTNVRLALSSVLNFLLISFRSRLGKTRAINVKSVPHIRSA
jgi:hypothetical protein